MADTEKPAVPFFKKKARPASSRRRSPAADSSQATSSTASASTPSASEVFAPTRKVATNPLIQGTKRTFSERERDGPDVKWRASGNAQDAAQLELEAIDGEEAQALLKKAKREEEDEERELDGLYHGQASYKSHIKKREDAVVPKAMRVGPVRSTNTIRTVTVVDYQPDVCKDYKGKYPSCCLATR